MGYRGNKFKYIVLIIIIILITFIFYMNKTRTRIYSDSRFLMDTHVTLKVKWKPGIEEIVNDTFSEMRKWETRLNRHSSESIIAKINESGEKGLIVSPELFFLLKQGKKYGELSGGAFDITITPLLDIWGFTENKENRVPTVTRIKETLPLINYNKITLNQEKSCVFLPETMAIDLGGMAKGFIVDKGIKFLEDAGISSALINAGGNIRVIGEKNPDRPWQIGIKKPRQENEIYNNYILGLKDGAVATSGDYERYFVEDGVRYSHLLDPRTGYPARELQAVTIYAESALKADILSTAVFIMGSQEGKKLIEKLPKVEGLMVKKGNIWYSSGFKGLIK